MEEKFKKILKEKTGLDDLLAHHFPHGPLVMIMEDRSFLCFYGAFALSDDESVYVFSEHCGHHVFWRDTIDKYNGPSEPDFNR